MTISGTFILEKNENLQELLKSLGVKDETIAKISAATPTVTLTLSGDKLEVQSKGAETVTNTLTLGTFSNYTFASGFQLEVNLSVSGNSGKGTLRKGDKTGEFTIEATDTQLIEVFSIGGNICKRSYKRV